MCNGMFISLFLVINWHLWSASRNWTVHRVERAVGYCLSCLKYWGYVHSPACKNPSEVVWRSLPTLFLACNWHLWSADPATRSFRLLANERGSPSLHDRYGWPPCMRTRVFIKCNSKVFKFLAETHTHAYVLFSFILPFHSKFKFWQQRKWGHTRAAGTELLWLVGTRAVPQ